jgi:membrane associated rhomboid family serine protease
VSETEPDPGWSEQYAETGGWPPPTEGQRRYGPGTTPSVDPADPTRPGRIANPADAGGQTGTTGSGGYGQPGYTSDEPHHWGLPVGPGQPDQPDQISGQPGRPAQAPGHSGQANGYDQAGQWRPAGQTGAYGPAAQPGQAGGYGPARQWGQSGAGSQPAELSGPASGWAPGDPAYGRLEPGAPRPPQRPRRPWDGRPAPARRPSTGTPVVTYTLIAICVVVYLIQQANPSFTTRYGLIPFAVEQGQYARLITSAFLHASVLHLITNMITLFIVGTPLERVLRPVRYLIVYVLSALGGSLLSVWLSPEFSVGVGASGAIFGLFGALVVLRRQVGAEAGGLVVLIGLNLVISFAVPNISWQAHIGGLVTGVLVALAFMGVDRLTRRPAT